MYNVEWASPTKNKNSWYMDVRQYIKNNIVPSHFSTQHKRAFRLKELSYQLMHGVLFRKHHNRVFLRCLEARDSEKVFHDLHDGPARRYFESNTKLHKVIQTSFYLPTLFIDSHAYPYKCLICQRFARGNKKSVAPLQPIVVEEPFQWWGLDIIGEIFPHSSEQYHYILTTTYYFMWWIEVVPLK